MQRLRHETARAFGRKGASCVPPCNLLAWLSPAASPSRAAALRARHPQPPAAAHLPRMPADGIHLAHDFYCFTVEPPEPLPADVLQAQQAQLAEQAQQMLLAPQAPRAAAPRGGPRTYQAPRGPPRDRPGGGGGGYGQRPQQRWQQRDGSGGGYQRQQRGGQGGGYQRQQRDGQAGGYQRQQRQPGGSGGWQARDPEEARP